MLGEVCIGEKGEVCVVILGSRIFQERDMAAVLFWLLAAGSVLGVLGSAGVSGSSEVQGASGVQGDYQLLQDTHKKGVDLAADRLNAHAGISHHFRYFRTVSQSDIQVGYGYFRVQYVTQTGG